MAVNPLILAMAVELGKSAPAARQGRDDLPDVVGRRMPPRAAIPAPAPLSAGCTTYFDYYVKARTDIKTFAWNREGHCTSVTAARRTIDEAEEEAMRECTTAWKECSLYAVGQALAPG